jgi:hypothetical protein
LFAHDLFQNAGFHRRRLAVSIYQSTWQDTVVAFDSDAALFPAEGITWKASP